MFYKPEFRRKISEKRQELSEINITQASKRVAAQLIYIHALQDANNIAHYMPTDGEIDPKFIIDCEPFRNKNFFLPVLNLEEKSLHFYPHTPNEILMKNKYNILEPSIENKKAIDWKNLDIVLVPLVGFDKNGNRLGRGQGYYDRTFAERLDAKKPLLIGLAYEFQKIDRIEPQDWDIPMDMIVTENDIYECPRHPAK
jgi:5-formyltetrahydrofolate cyclo-ligase